MSNLIRALDSRKPIPVQADTRSQKGMIASSRLKAATAFAFAAVIALAALLASYRNRSIQRDSQADRETNLSLCASVAAIFLAVSIKHVLSSFQESKNYTYTDLTHCIISPGDNSEKIKSILSSGSVLEGEYEDWEYALSVASFNGYAEIVSILLTKEFRVSDNEFARMLRGASKNGHLKVVSLLLSHRPDIAIFDLAQSCLCAAEFFHIEVVKLLLSSNSTLFESAQHCLINRDYSDADRNDRIHFFLEMARFLLSKGIAISQMHWQTLVQNASIEGDLELVHLLLSNRFTISTFDLGYIVIQFMENKF